MAELDPIRVRFVADVSQFRAGVISAQTSVMNFTKTATGSAVPGLHQLNNQLDNVKQPAEKVKTSFTRLENAMRSMALSTLQLPGPLNRLGVAFLDLPTKVLGVVAAIGLVVAAFRAAAKGVKEASDAMEESSARVSQAMRMNLSDAAKAAATFGDAVREQTLRIDEARKAYERLQYLQIKFTPFVVPRSLGAVTATPAEIQARKQAWDAEITALKALLAGRREQREEQERNPPSLQQHAQAAIADAIQRVTAAERNLLDVRRTIGGATEEQLRTALTLLDQEERGLVVLNAALKALGENDPHAQLILGAERARALFEQEERALRRMNEALLETRQELVPMIREIAVVPPGPVVPGPGAGGRRIEREARAGGLRITPPKAATEGVRQSMADLFTESDAALQEQLNAIGRSAMESLVAGFIEGTRDFEDLLKRVMIDFAVSAILGPFTKILGIFSPSHVAAGWGRQIGAGLELGLAQARPGVGASMTALAAGPARMGLDVDWSGFPAAATPFDVARDATWQRVLRESMLVAKSHGFRL